MIPELYSVVIVELARPSQSDFRCDSLRPPSGGSVGRADLPIFDCFDVISPIRCVKFCLCVTRSPTSTKSLNPSKISIMTSARRQSFRQCSLQCQCIVSGISFTNPELANRPSYLQCVVECTLKQHSRDIGWQCVVEYTTRRGLTSTMT